MMMDNAKDATGADEMDRIDKLLQYMIDVAGREDPFPVMSDPESSKINALRRGIGEDVLPRQIKQLMNSEPSHQIRWPRDGDYPYTRVELRSLLVDLTCELRHLLNQYIDEETDHIGCAWPNMGRGSFTMQENYDHPPADISVCSMRDFAKSMLKGAVLLGSERVVSLLAGWVQGQPVEFRTCVLLNGLVIRDGLKPVRGVHIEPIPLSMDRDLNDFSSTTHTPVEDLLGRTLISLDCTVAPALFKPYTKRYANKVHTSFVSDVNVDPICIALALEANKWVEAATTWHNYGECRALFMRNNRPTWTFNNSSLQGLPGMMSRTKSWEVSGIVSTLELGEEHIIDIDDMRLKDILTSVNDATSQRLRIAINRWLQSKRLGRAWVDRAIDLRIAFEALYTPKGINTEMRYRLSLNGALHLGTDASEKKQIQQQLKSVYDIASKAVHASIMDMPEAEQQKIRDGQDLCRRGICKMLRAGTPDWTDLLMRGTTE